MRKQLIAFFLFLNFQAYTQATSAIGTWQTHLAYTNGLIAQEVGSKIYCLTNAGFYSYNTEDKTTLGLSKIQGFSDAFATTIGYDQASNVLLIGYAGGNIDIVTGNTITPNPGISGTSAQVTSLNAFYYYNNVWYIATATGIFTLDYNRREGSWESPSTFNLSESVKGITILNDTIYAASVTGVIKCDLSSAYDFSNWQSISTQSCTGLVTFDAHVFGSFTTGVQELTGTGWTNFRYNSINPASTSAIKSMVVNHGKLVILDTKYVTEAEVNNNTISTITANASANYAMVDTFGNLWLAANSLPLYQCAPISNSVLTVNYYDWPNRPYSSGCSKLYNYQNIMYAAGGGVNSHYFTPLYSTSGYYAFSGGSWQNFNAYTSTSNWVSTLSISHDTVADVMTVKVDPISKNIWMGAMEGGAIEFNSNGSQFMQQFKTVPGAPNTPISIYDMAFDSNDNLWMSYYTNNGQGELIVRTPSNKWNVVSSPAAGAANYGPILIDNYNQVWVIRPPSNEMVVYNVGNNVLTKSPKIQQLNNNAGQGNLPSNNVYCFALDKKGEVWVGTSLGLTVFYDPSLIFSGNNFDAQQIYIQTGSTPGYLFNNTPINAIAVDGANRKWVATGQGVYLVSADGTQIQQQFTAANSPLISNNVTSIAVNGETGEVFFATDKGIVSYRSTAEEANVVNTNLYAFPNPVKPGYTGVIAIHGLPIDGDVKITDVNGNLAYETTALGSQAIWDGKNFSGRPVNSGVYLVFCTSPDGTQTVTTKIVIVR